MALAVATPRDDEESQDREEPAVSDTKARTAPKSQRWSQRVTETSDALDLEGGVFALDDPRAIARSLKRSAERSQRRKSDPFRSAMSMLTFYMNRAGKNLPERQRAVLNRAKAELRELFHKPARKPAGRTPKRRSKSA
jgi:hypothetical protein